ncbi:MAG: putative phosphoprotein [Wufeng shrew rhabdovirus 9]|nr:MAG: putative phosphoprotein [Wufeng shrew rhabdovirus 9]
MSPKKTQTEKKKSANKASVPKVQEPLPVHSSVQLIDPALNSILTGLGSKSASQDVSFLTDSDLSKSMGLVLNADKALAADYRQGEILCNMPERTISQQLLSPEKGQENLKTPSSSYDPRGHHIEEKPDLHSSESKGLDNRPTLEMNPDDEVTQTSSEESDEESECSGGLSTTYQTEMCQNFEHPINAVLKNIENELNPNGNTHNNWKAELEVAIISVFDKGLSSLSKKGDEGKALYSLCRGMLSGIQLYKTYKQQEDEKRWYKMQENQRHLEAAIEGLNTTVSNLTSALNDQKTELVALRGELAKKNTELMPVPSSSTCIPPPSVTRQIVPKISLAQFFKDQSIPVNKQAVPVLMSMDHTPILDPQQVLKLKSSIAQYMKNNNVKALGDEEVRNIAYANHVSCD